MQWMRDLRAIPCALVPSSGVALSRCFPDSIERATVPASLNTQAAYRLRTRAARLGMLRPLVWYRRW